MGCSVKELSELSGVSVRTLHWYDKIGLLVPVRNEQNGYRVYTKAEVDRLQDILYFRELGLELSEIAAVLSACGQTRADMLKSYRQRLVQRREHISRLLKSVDKTINSIKGDYVMSNKEKFEVFKENLIEENEQKFGKEARERYGDDAVDGSNELIRQMGKERFEQMQALGEEINTLIKTALDNGYAPESEKGRAIAEKHRDWLMYTWKSYSVEAHKGLAQGYTADERFTEYYEKAAGKGAAQFLCDAVCNNL